GVRRVELCDRGIEVVDVEHHLYRDSPFVIEAEQIERLVTRCPRARVRSAELQSGESQPLAAHCDRLDSVRASDFEKPPCLTWPVARRKISLGEADSLHGRIGCSTRVCRSS